MAFQPGLPGSQFPSEDALIRRIQDIERSMRELSAANPFAPMGMKPVPGGVEFSGNLSVPNGSISNAALQAPVSPLATHVGTNNFGLNTGPNVELVRATINVPAGYTQALVFATATLHAWNNNGVNDDAYLVAKINGTQVGASSQCTAVPSADICIPATGTMLLTGLGATFYVAAAGSSANSAWAVNSNNFVNLDVMTVFLR
ncbi:hypothetical protein ABLI39_13940 [Pseudarthrobacter sp. B907]|uniref:hypothetical protein n=1 Tax=Pseudarthrobacter sp. B907 TaxID=3158261 RepID=UPI0032DAE569